MNDKILESQSFEQKSFEENLYQNSGDTFSCSVDSINPKFSTMMPPPNVTGSLHLGHALTYTLPDILVRFKRMNGFDVLWQPGTDHAGIATQMVVERQLASDNVSRHDIGREKFLKKIWEWKEQSGNTIINQQKRLRISPDWTKQCFTMDDGLSKAVTAAFVRLYKDGLIYKDKRLVNWDTKLQTAVSDLEVINREEKGTLWHIDYILADGSSKITIATTRPETMLGDTAVAVHPKDDRYKHLIGKSVKLPITYRIIPIIGDEYCDPLKGSGAVKITPSHDFNDFLVGQRHKLPLINILNKNGTLNDQVPISYQGLTISKVRIKILEELEAEGLLVKQETITHMKPYSDRTDTEIQPLLTDQWFVNAKELATPAIKAVKNGDIKFFPPHWENTYFEWLYNIQPWCISRQIWWGHQIPAWYGPDQTIFVAETREGALEEAFAHYGEKVDLVRDNDVLDTWFSSALWPFATLGWPNKTLELKRYYPTDILVTGFDIIFFWVARMIMMGLYFMNDVPFKNVYIHNLVRDEKGHKMSKSKGNIIDPIKLLDKFGSDALRFTLAILASPGQDIRIGDKTVEIYRNFVTKIWNAAKFLKMHDIRQTLNFDIKEVISNKQIHPLNLWMISEVLSLARAVTNNLEHTSNVSQSHYRFDLAAKSIYEMVWGSFCDFYLEAIKVLLKDPKYKDETAAIALWCFKEILKIAHPFMPMITDHLWQVWNKESITKEKWLEDDLRCVSVAEHNTNGIKELIAQIRSYKGLFNVTFSKKIPITISDDISENNQTLIKNTNKFWYIETDKIVKYQNIIQQVSGVSDIKFTNNPEIAKGVMPFIWRGRTVYLHFTDAIPTQEMLNILESKLKTLKTEIQHLEKKLDNQAYKNSKLDQWESDRDLHVNKNKEYERLNDILKQL